MDLSTFEQHYHVTHRPAAAPAEAAAGLPPDVAELFERFGGCTFDDGLYRVHTAASSRMFTDLARQMFPEIAGDIGDCFGFDWLGRQFALRPGGAWLLEPGAGDARGIPDVGVAEFHNVVLVDQSDAALAVNFFEEWSAKGGPLPITFSACVGYRIPLFLSGQDEVANLELTDMEVYWTLHGQLRQQIMNKPVGTKVRRFKLRRG